MVVICFQILLQFLVMRLVVELKDSCEREIIFDSHTYIIDTPFDWVGPENASRNHRYKIHAAMLDEVLQRLSENHNQNYLFRCNQVALEWVEKFIFGDEVDEFAWYDMSVGQRSSLLSFLIKKSLIVSPKRNFLMGKSQQIKPLEMLKLIICADVHLHELQFEERIASHIMVYSKCQVFYQSAQSCHFWKYSGSGRSLAMRKIEEMLQHHFFQDAFTKSILQCIMLSWRIIFISYKMQGGWMTANRCYR